MRHLYADFVGNVSKPMRYLGGEYLSVIKDPQAVAVRVCLAFPDVYDIGMSHLGTKILYSLLNKCDDIWAERAFCPWIDMEAELRTRGLPLISLESQLPLAEFDVLGFSLQYELTFTNVLTMLELGGVPLRAVDRAADAPLILVGGSVASHPEPLAPFFDAAFLGEAEASLPDLCRAWAAMRVELRAGTRTRLDALAELASRFALYVPALYATAVDADTGMTVVDAPLDPRAPARVRRAMIEDLDAFPFPSDTPVPYAEAVFERASVEIARGCTEGCRFCQAGMIYRPVRERSPGSIADTLIGGVDKAGYDETGLTCLSTADFSSITPLVKSLAAELKKRGVSMSVASLRAYGLNDDLLDELATTRISGLTFAPEAGTQRMRDVVNKNITEAHIEDSARRVFARGWHRLKLYFMIGLPTEEDDDVLGIMETGQRMLKIGWQTLGGKAEVTVSCSSHVPKPHTPYQWAAQNPPTEIHRKQQLLRTRLRDRSLRLKYHHRGISFIEGVLARGDRRLADVIEKAWRAGARFDGWDEMFDEARWTEALTACGLNWEDYLATRPVTARLPWDHLDVGLEDGFLLGEYRKALKGRASPPCGKVAGTLIHHTNLADAEADQRKLVCYDCGVACDLSKMRSDRKVALQALGALTPTAPRTRLPMVAADADDAIELPADVALRGGGSPAEAAADGPDVGPDEVADAGPVDAGHNDRLRADRVRKAGFIGADLPFARYRLRFAKTGRAAFLGHLDLGRLWARTFRRADLPLAMSRGFSPKPRLSFGPALGLGVPSLGEVIDFDLEHAPMQDGVFVRTFEAPADAPRVAVPADVVRARLSEALPEGLVVIECQELSPGAPGLGVIANAVDVLIRPVDDGLRWDQARARRLADAFWAKPEVLVRRAGKPDSVGKGGKAGRASKDAREQAPKHRDVDVRGFVTSIEVIADDAAVALCQALDWPETQALFSVRVSATTAGSARPPELAQAIGVWGDADPRATHALVARLGVVMNAPPPPVVRMPPSTTAHSAP